MIDDTTWEDVVESHYSKVMADMMGQFSIGECDRDGYDPHHPVDAARPVPDPRYQT